MRKLTFVVGAEDDGRLIKRVVRGRMGISHRGFSDIKNQHAMLVDGRPVLFYPDRKHFLVGRVIGPELLDRAVFP